MMSIQWVFWCVTVSNCWIWSYYVVEFFMFFCQISLESQLQLHPVAQWRPLWEGQRFCLQKCIGCLMSWRSMAPSTAVLGRVTLFPSHVSRFQPRFHIASKFTCGDDKAAYLTTFGIAPLACADDLHKRLCINCNTVGIHGILQLSMDGPDVNWKLFDTLSRDLEEETGFKLLN